MSKVKDIASILPEGLDESTVESIFELVDSTINEQVSERIGLLEAKVTAYLRTKIDAFKEQALAELSEENELYRNARLFESVRTLMALELSESDEDSALSEVTGQYGELQEEFDTLVDQVNALVAENEKLQNTVKVLDKKATVAESSKLELEEEKTQLLEEVENLKAASEEEFQSSEKAVVASFADKEVIEEKTHYRNEFLDDEVLRLSLNG